MGCGSSAQVYAIAIPKPPVQDRPSEVDSRQNLLNPDQSQPQDEPNSGSPNRQKIKKPAVLPPIVMKRLPKPKPEYKTSCFLFGETSTERKILCFNSKSLTFSTVLSRAKVPCPPLKYQPIEVIYEQSQQLFSSNLFITNSNPPYNFMLALWVEAHKIFMCGGVNYDLTFISNESFIFDTAFEAPNGLQNRNRRGHELMGTRFDKIPFMQIRRYSHMGVIMKQGGKKYVYVFGGSSENQEVLKECQRYSLDQAKWTKIAPMHLPRSTGFALIFRSKVYIFGGYSGNSKRPKQIEVYSPQSDSWEVLELKLHRGIETGLIVSHRPNEIMIIGGNLEGGSVKSTIKINLQQKTYVCDADMKKPRMLQKGIQTETDFIVFGGDFADGMEIYSFKEKRWREHPTSYSLQLSVDDINRFSFSAETVVVEYQDMAAKAAVLNTELQQSQAEQPGKEQKYFLFSNDEYPCIMEINMTKSLCIKKAVPMALRLRSHMGAVCIGSDKYLICGGTRQFYEKASKAAFIYDSSDYSAVEIAKMNEARYSFAIYQRGQHVYVFGGKPSEENVLASCERLNIAKKDSKWETVGVLKKARHSCLVVQHKNKLYIVGGADHQNRKIDTIETFDPATLKFEQLDAPKVQFVGSTALRVEGQQRYYIVGGHDQIGDNHYIHRLQFAYEKDKKASEGFQMLENSKIETITSASRPISFNNHPEQRPNQDIETVEQEEPSEVLEVPALEGLLDTKPHQLDPVPVTGIADYKIRIKIENVGEVQKVIKAVNCKAGIFLIKKNKTQLFQLQEKKLVDKILVNQLQMNAFDLQKLSLA